ncbi:unnamed protein product, partial [Pylaiella littoralis]
AGLGCGEDALCRSPLVRWAGTLAPIRTCSVGETDPACGGRNLPAEAVCSGSSNLGESTEPSGIAGIPPSSFDDGRVVNTGLAAGDDRGSPCVGVNKGRPASAEPGGRGWPGREEPGRLWQGGVPKGGLPDFEAPTVPRANMERG